MSPPPSPKKSADVNTLGKPPLSRAINTLLNETTPKSKELVEKAIKPKNIVKNKPINTINAINVNVNVNHQNGHMTDDNHMTKFHKNHTINKIRKIRKNPYPIKSPTKSSPGITFKLDVFTPFKEDPMALLHINKPYQTLTSECSTPSLTSITSSPESTPPSSPRPTQQNMDKKQQGKRQTKTKRYNVTSVERKRKRQPLTISHLPHFNTLHNKEVEVASTLRLTPVQYLTAKHTLVSAAQRYFQKSLPFRKSDAQKLLRIDVNKASKLWEFFQQ
ncbi:10425_t:CDS:2, partial [Racocetra fulgida]